MGVVIVYPAEVDRVKFALANLYYARHIRTIITVVKLEAPIKTGRLRNSHQSDLPRKDGPDYLIRIHAYTDYAHAVYVGTSSRPRRTAKIGGKAKVIKTVARVAKNKNRNPWFARAFRGLGFRDVRDLG